MLTEEEEEEEEDGVEEEAPLLRELLLLWGVGSTPSHEKVTVQGSSAPPAALQIAVPAAAVAAETLMGECRRAEREVCDTRVALKVRRKGLGGVCRERGWD